MNTNALIEVRRSSLQSALKSAEAMAVTDGSAASITELAVRENEDRNEISRHLPLAFLAPDIVDKILKGLQPVELTAEKLRRVGPLPYRWDEQRALLGFIA